MGKRRKSRILALQVMYQCDAGRGTVEDILPSFMKSQKESSPDVVAFAVDLARGVMAKREIVDREIEKLSQHWDPERMAVIDRNILRLALYEIHFRDDIPPKVSINEYVAIAKKFSTEESGSFVNGILDRSFRDSDSGTERADGGG